MNKTNLLRRIIQTTSIASVLTIGFMLPEVKAATFRADVMAITGGNAYDQAWIFEVEIVEGTPQKVKFTVKGDRFTDYMYSFPVTNITDGKYTFSGEDFAMNPPFPPKMDKFGLTMSGMFNPTTNVLIIDSPVSSGGLTFDVKNVKPTPEPSQTIGLLGLGILGTASILKRKKATKELDQVP